MKISEELTTQSENLLKQLDFKLFSETEEGMVKAIEWHNDQARFVLLNDRGYVEAFIITKSKPFERLDLIKLLRFIKNDPGFYRNELITANLSYTLPPNTWIRMLYDNYKLIERFLTTFSEETNRTYTAFRNVYEGL